MAPESYRHWRLTEDGERIAWLAFDRAGKSVNSLSGEALEELALIVEELAARPPKGLVILSGKESGFIAGADVTEFSGLDDAEMARAHIERGQKILGQLEGLPFPTVALIKGFCLGGGLELALACRYRIAADLPETRLGLPEVKLGIHPGFGGTVRLPALIGPLPALDLMLTGKTVSARKAAALGLVDYAVPERQLENAARSTVNFAPAPREHGLVYFISSMWFARPPIAAYLRRQVAKRVDERRYPAPYALVELWKKFGANPDAMLREEARSVASLIVGATSKSLVRVFLLQEGLRSFGRGDGSSLRHVHVVGGGTMGGDIAAWCTLQGMRVTIQDVDAKRLAGVIGRAATLFRKNLHEPRLVQAALDRLIPDLAGDGVTRADVVIEAIFEDAAAKRELYRQLEPRLKEGAILATNTSTIPLEELTEGMARPERLVGLHFFNPVAKMELVEVVRGEKASEATIARATSFVGAIRRLPLPVKSSPAFLVNRILMPYLLEAVTMEAEGIPAAAIDRAAVDFGMPMGPLALADTVGLDICLAAARILARHLDVDVPKRLEELVAAGRLGRKSGSGFYSYEGGEAKTSGVPKDAPPAEDLAERLILRLLNEAVACLRDGVVADADLVDVGVVFGTGFAPFRGGPLAHARSEGVQAILTKLRLYEERYGRRYAADEGWLAFMKEGKE